VALAGWHGQHDQIRMLEAIRRALVDI
jgi:hypothetical protein